MNTTTITLEESTRDELRTLKDEQSLPHYDATVRWLLNQTASS